LRHANATRVIAGTADLAAERRMMDQIPADWRIALAHVIGAPSFRQLVDFVATERAGTDIAIYPPESDVFTALRLTPLASVRAVILGQDPYHGEGQAHGLAFSVSATERIPPSLRNILDEWDADVGGPRPLGGSLEPWARHGALLLNTVLSVRQGSANSHRDKGWEPFTDAIVRAVADNERAVAFLLWGRVAKRKVRLINRRHVVVRASHPSPLSATRGQTPFRTSRPFSTANARLAALEQPPIDWSLTAAA
jgi:uracil-DNA glycosylase